MYEIKIIDCPKQGKVFYHVYLYGRLINTFFTYLAAFDFIAEQQDM